jgi:hypothetical protein
MEAHRQGGRMNNEQNEQQPQQDQEIWLHVTSFMHDGQLTTNGTCALV